jgi:hypothetical protein
MTNNHSATDLLPVNVRHVVTHSPDEKHESFTNVNTLTSEILSPVSDTQFELPSFKSSESVNTEFNHTQEKIRNTNLNPASFMELDPDILAKDLYSKDIGTGEILTLINGKPVKSLEYCNKHMSAEQKLAEKMKCQFSFLYWMENYAYTKVSGGFIHMGSSEQWKSSPKFRILCKLFEQHDSVLLLSSRQIGKTTLGLLYAVWAMTFYPKIEIMFLTLNTTLAKDAVSRMKDAMFMLPNWMRVENASQAAKTTFIDLVNGSKFLTSFVSGAVDPDKVGRGLSQPIIILDEFAFCNYADIVYTSMQPSLSTARKYSKLNGYPTLLLGVSTPNGAGDNQFYSMLSNSTDIEEIYDFENKKLYDNYKEILSEETKNSFISVKIHWSETNRDEAWYKQQCKDLNFNKRRINQELDLAFLGSASSIFDDDIIMQLLPKKPIHEMQLPHGLKMKLFSEIEPGEMYLAGVDSSASTGPNSDWSTIVLTRARDAQEVGVVKCQFAVVKKFAGVVKAFVKAMNTLYGANSDNLKLIIERNSFGKGVVEELMYNDPSIDDFDYESYVWHEEMANGELVPGLYTSNSSNKMGNGKRDTMFSELMNHVNAYPNMIHSIDMISELRNLVQHPSGRIEAGKIAGGKMGHDDVVMAYNFCLYARKLMIKSGELSIEGEYAAFALSPETIMNFIDVNSVPVHLQNQRYIETANDYDIIIEDGFGHRLGNKNKSEELDISDYMIIGF